MEPTEEDDVEELVVEDMTMEASMDIATAEEETATEEESLRPESELPAENATEAIDEVTDVTESAAQDMAIESTTESATTTEGTDAEEVALDASDRDENPMSEGDVHSQMSTETVEECSYVTQ